MDNKEIENVKLLLSEINIRIDSLAETAASMANWPESESKTNLVSSVIENQRKLIVIADQIITKLLNM